jgi:hypothetical protein
MFCVFLLDSISHLEEEGKEKEFLKEILLVSTGQICLRGEVSNEIWGVYSVSEFDAAKL